MNDVKIDVDSAGKPTLVLTKPAVKMNWRGTKGELVGIGTGLNTASEMDGPREITGSALLCRAYLDEWLEAAALRIYSEGVEVKEN